MCHKYIGKIEDHDSFVTCDVCLERVDLSNPSCLNVFVIIDPREAIKMLLKDHEKYYDYVVNRRVYDGCIHDIFDGKLYRSFVNNLPDDIKHNYLTAIFNTDGAPRFKSSHYSIWLIYLQLNEIPLQARFSNVVLCGTWFGKDKPEMTAFLQPFTDTMNQLENEGIECFIGTELRKIKLYVLVVCVDSVARAPVQGIKAFNGKYGYADGAFTQESGLRAV